MKSFTTNSETEYSSLGDAKQSRPRFSISRFQGWRMSVLIGACLTFIVLLINASILIWAMTGTPVEGALATIYSGSCSKAKYLSPLWHVSVNVISTLLLAASNNCMQCLSSPTRADIDVAHSKGIRLDIGTSGVRNLRHINWVRGLLWLLLGMSSIPLHLL